MARTNRVKIFQAEAAIDLAWMRQEMADAARESTRQEIEDAANVSTRHDMPPVLRAKTRHDMATASTARSRQDMGAVFRAITRHAMPDVTVLTGDNGPQATFAPTQAVSVPTQRLGIFYD